MTTHDNGPALDGWRVERRACPFCEIDAKICGCPTGELLVAQMQAEWLDR